MSRRKICVVSLLMKRKRWAARFTRILTATMVMAVAAPSKRTGPEFNRLVNGPPHNKNDEMRCETQRLNTFKTWPNWAAAWPTLLVKAGFYYTGTADQVACFCCSGHLKNWEAGDSPMAEHKRYFPQCRFVSGLDSTNVPLEKASEMPPEDKRRATAGVVRNGGPSSLARSTEVATARLPQRNQHVSLQYSAVINEPSVNPQGGHRMATSGATDIHSLSVEQLQDMKRESKRLESFTDWPTSAYVRPEHLATTGVYSLGIADRVRCAFCCGVLRNWLPGDDPMVVHRKYFPKCAFVDDARAAGNVSIEEENTINQQASQVCSVLLSVEQLTTSKYAHCFVCSGSNVANHDAGRLGKK